MSDRDDARSLVNIIMASLLAVAIGFIILMLFYSRAQGETRRASSTVYTQGANAAPKARERRKFRYSYRRSRSRAVAVSTRAAVVSQPASRAAEIPSPGAHQPSQPAATEAGQMLLMGHWSAAYYFEPYYGHPAHAQAEPEFIGPIMLERGDPEPAQASPSNLHLVALGAIAAAFAAILIYAATGGQRERQPPQWAPWSDA